jgi:hypothetical protein
MAQERESVKAIPETTRSWRIKIHWSDGVMEYWNEKQGRLYSFSLPLFQHSNTPVFHRFAAGLSVPFPLDFFWCMCLEKRRLFVLEFLLDVQIMKG